MWSVNSILTCFEFWYLKMRDTLVLARTRDQQIVLGSAIQMAEEKSFKTKKQKIFFFFFFKERNRNSQKFKEQFKRDWQSESCLTLFLVGHCACCIIHYISDPCWWKNSLLNKGLILILIAILLAENIQYTLRPFCHRLQAQLVILCVRGMFCFMLFLRSCFAFVIVIVFRTRSCCGGRVFLLPLMTNTGGFDPYCHEYCACWVSLVFP